MKTCLVVDDSSVIRKVARRIDLASQLVNGGSEAAALLTRQAQNLVDHDPSHHLPR